ncbi:MAG: hypothetical protein AB1599_10130 [Planctomycetota bacterium]
MVKNSKMLERFEREQLRKENLTYAQKLAIFNALWNEHLHLNGKRRDNPLEGIESRIQMARILNSANIRRTTTRKGQ